MSEIVTVEEALGLLAVHGDAGRVLAGGQSLMPMLNFRLARPGHVIDINHLAVLATVSPVRRPSPRPAGSPAPGSSRR